MVDCPIGQVHMTHGHMVNLDNTITNQMYG